MRSSLLGQFPIELPAVEKGWRSTTWAVLLTNYLAVMISFSCPRKGEREEKPLHLDSLHISLCISRRNRTTNCYGRRNGSIPVAFGSNTERDLHLPVFCRWPKKMERWWKRGKSGSNWTVREKSCRWTKTKSPKPIRLNSTWPRILPSCDTSTKLPYCTRWGADTLPVFRTPTPARALSSSIPFLPWPSIPNG